MEDDISVCLAKSEHMNLCVVGVRKVGSTAQGGLSCLVEGYEVRGVQWGVTNTVLLL